MASNTSYSQFFNIDNIPKYSKKYSRQNLGILGHFNAPYWVVDDGFGTVTFDATQSEFDKLMQGFDDTSNKYVNQLKNLYKDFGNNADEYKKNLEPVIENITSDIEKQNQFSKKFQGLLDSSKDSFYNGINIDPNANRTRAEYMGAVADQYSNAREQLKRNMESQGLNPYANKGADRELALKQAQGLGMAAGKAYTDWRAGYNRDNQAQIANKAAFLNLSKGAGDLIAKTSGLRMAKAGLYGNILGANNLASTAKQKGINTALDFNEGRRAERLALQQAKAKSDINKKMLANKMNEKLQTEQLDLPLGWGQVRTRIR